MTTRAKLVLAVALMIGALAYVCIPLLAKADLPASSPVHERGYVHSVNTSNCVVCGQWGDAGVLFVTAGARYVVTVADSSGSPARVANTAGCVTFGAGGIGEIVPANVPLDWIADKAPDGGSSANLSCCAQTATASPVGPYICTTPVR